MQLDFPPPRPPSPPVLAVECSTGLGKSHQMRDMAAAAVRELRQRGDSKGTVCIFVPTHRLGDEQVQKFHAEHPGLTARRFLGTTQDDPNQPGKKMCHRSTIVADLCRDGAALRDLCAKPRKGIYCPHHVAVSDEPCGYSIQAQQQADVWFLPHQKLFSGAPACVGTPQLVGIDEAFWQASLEGFGAPYRLSLETLRSGRGIPQLQQIADTVYRAIAGLPDGFIDMEAIRSTLGPGADDLRALAHRLEMSRLEKLNIRPDMDSRQLREVLDRLEAGAVMRLAKFWELLCKGLNEGGTTPFVRKCTEQSSEGTTTWLYLYDRKSIHADWQQPTVVLDATLPRKIIETFFPNARVERLDCPMQHTHVVQVRDKSLSKAMLLPNKQVAPRKRAERERNVKRLLSLCAVLASRYVSGVEVGGRQVKVLLVTYKDLEEQLIEGGLPEGVATLHYGATSGLDAYGQVPCIVLAGRLEVPLREAEHIASVLAGRMLEQVPDADAWYQQTLSAIETPDNLIPVAATRHPDPLVEEVRWSVNEGQLVQAIGRGRGVRRTADNPLDLFVLTNVPLPLVVDQVVQWEDIVPTSVETVLAEHGVAPLSRGEMVRVLPDVWPNADVARYAAEKFFARYPEAATGFGKASAKSDGENAYKRLPIGKFPTRLSPKDPQDTQKRLITPFLLVQYTRKSKGAKPCRAVIRKGHGAASARAALEKLVGPLRDYRIIGAIGSDLPAPPVISKPTVLSFNPATQTWEEDEQHPVVCGMTDTGRYFHSVTRHPTNLSTGGL